MGVKLLRWSLVFLDSNCVIIVGIIVFVDWCGLYVLNGCIIIIGVLNEWKNDFVKWLVLIFVVLYGDCFWNGCFLFIGVYCVVL